MDMPPIRDAESLGQQIRRQRKALGWSQKQLADHASTDARQISRIETAAHEPKLSLLLTVIAALDLDLGLIPRAGKSPEATRSNIEDIF